MTGLEYATDTKAEVVGKPEKTFFLAAIQELGINAEDTVMIGDVSDSIYLNDQMYLSVTIMHYFCKHFLLLI